MPGRRERVLWSHADAAELRAHRGSKRHTQTECAGEIVRLGAPRATQSTIYNWETGRTRPSKESLAAIRAYLGDASPTSLPPRPEESGPSEVSEGSAARDDVGPLINPLTGERELSPRQAALVDRVNCGGGSPERRGRRHAALGRSPPGA